MSNFIENLKNELEHNTTYINLYNDFENDDLKIVFSSLHAKLVSLLELMNEKLPTGNFYNYYPAAPSREFIFVIKKIEELKKETDCFILDDYYQTVIDSCKKILREKAGSSIQRNTDKINIYYDKSIFKKRP